MQNNNGIVLGVVADLDDDKGLGRVKVTFPHLNDQLSNWCRLSSPMGGAKRGFFFRPEVGDQMLVAFEQGNPRRPYILGGLWNEEDKPPEDDGKATKNNWRFIRSRSGHLLKFDDTQGAETIEIESGSAKHRIFIEDAGKKIRIETDNGDIDVMATAGTVTVKATTVKLEAKDIEMNADASMKINAAQIDIKSSGPMTLKGQMININ